jgi:hypothetical protein
MGEREDKKAPSLAQCQKGKNKGAFPMYKLREMDVDDKVCEQVDIALLSQVYPKEAIERCVGETWKEKRRRVRQSTMLSLVWFVIAMALWSRLSQCLVWEKLVTKIADIHPLEPDAQLSDSALPWATRCPGIHRTSETHAGAVCDHGQSRSDAFCVLWSISTDGH